MKYTFANMNIEDIYKIYPESFLGKDHLKKIIEEAQTIVNIALETKENTS